MLNISNMDYTVVTFLFSQNSCRFISSNAVEGDAKDEWTPSEILGNKRCVLTVYRAYFLVFVRSFETLFAIERFKSISF